MVFIFIAVISQSLNAIVVPLVTKVQHLNSLKTWRHSKLVQLGFTIQLVVNYIIQTEEIILQFKNVLFTDCIIKYQQTEILYQNVTVHRIKF